MPNIINNITRKLSTRLIPEYYNFFLKSKRTLILSLSALLPFQAGAATVFINEFHYDNSGTDINEGVEIIGLAGTNLSNWSIEFYNGNTGTVYKTSVLDGVITDQQNGYGVLAFAISGLQNGAADGIALVNNNQLVEFISYEGSLVAVDGAASGHSSIDVGVAQTTSTDIGLSIQRIGTGTINSHFGWALDNASFGEINTGQSIYSTVPIPAPAILFISALSTLCIPKYASRYRKH